jgi:photosystem II stability/assembly factor-like uncharacterized protein
VNGLTLAPSDPDTLFAQSFFGQMTIYRSRDAGATWTNVLVLPGEVEIAVHPSDGSIVYVAAGDAGVSFSSDGGDHWQPRNLGLPVPAARSIAFDADPSTLYLVNAGVVYRSIDAGRSWFPSLTGARDFQRVTAHARVPEPPTRPRSPSRARTGSTARPTPAPTGLR